MLFRNAINRKAVGCLFRITGDVRGSWSRASHSGSTFSWWAFHSPVRHYFIVLGSFTGTALATLSVSRASRPARNTLPNGGSELSTRVEPPVFGPISVTYDIQTSGGGASIQAAETVTTSTTTIHFDNPQQFGYQAWPALVVSANVDGSLTEVNLDETLIAQLEQLSPGFQTVYDYSQLPRTFTFQETLTTYPREGFSVASAASLAAAAADQDILMGFTRPARIG
jgi:hypothetical protein